jgi:hypothetical protein
MSGRFCSKSIEVLFLEQNRPDIRAYFSVFCRYFFALPIGYVPGNEHRFFMFDAKLLKATVSDRRER